MEGDPATAVDPPVATSTNDDPFAGRRVWEPPPPPPPPPQPLSWVRDLFGERAKGGPCAGSTADVAAATTLRPLETRFSFAAAVLLVLYVASLGYYLYVRIAYSLDLGPGAW